MQSSNRSTAFVELLGIFTGGTAWTWAMLQLPTRAHFVLSSSVQENAPALVGFAEQMSLRSWIFVVVGVWITWTYARSHRGRWSPVTRGGKAAIDKVAVARVNSAWWLFGAVPLVVSDALRYFGVRLPLTWFEPLWLCFITGEIIVGAYDRSNVGRLVRRPNSVPTIVLAVANIVAGALWYLQAETAYLDYMLGFPDFGVYVRRIANTWAGRGFLADAPQVPPFWDHFNPGLALLAPIWGLIPDARLFIALQVLCLIAGVPAVYGIARTTGASTSTAALWGAAYLLVPLLGQLNLTCGYGWHPVSLALPLLLVVVWLLQLRRYFAAVAVAILAFSFEETVIFVTAWLACGCLVASIYGRKASRLQLAVVHSLTIRQWAFTIVALFITFVLIGKFAGFAKFQMGRLAHLGDSLVEVALSPLIRPTVFWPQLLRMNCLIFVVALISFFGLRNSLRGWSLLSAIAVPVFVLCIATEPSATSIGFHYMTMLIPILVLAAMQGALSTNGKNEPASDNTADKSGEWNETTQRDQRLRRGGIRAVATCLTASIFFGVFPWSTPTLDNVIGQTYIDESRSPVYLNRIVGSPGNQALNEAVSLANHPDAKVFATARVASHFLQVQRLELVAGLNLRGDLWRQEVGEGKSPLTLFDWIVFDMYESFHQSPEHLLPLLDEARTNQFEPVLMKEGVIVLKNAASRPQ